MKQAWVIKGGLSLAVALMLAGAGQAPAQAPAKAPQTYPDWSGVWNPHERNIFDPEAYIDPRNAHTDNAANMREWPPYNAEWEAKYVQKLADNKAGLPTDPTASCKPGGMPRIMTSPYPMEYIIQPHRVTIMFELSNQIRRIWTDGRKHPTGDDLEVTYRGDSIGHWEGDTLVIDTVGMKGDTVYDVTAAPHSDKLHVTERIRRISQTQMEDILTVEDPVAFTKPWVVRRLYDLKPDWNIEEYVCEDNNRNPILPDGTTATGVVH
jgi:hypothetical protein